MSSYSTLRKVREVLGDERRWTRGAFALAADGSETHPRSRHAVAWCLVGAAEHCATDRIAYWRARDAILLEINLRNPGIGVPRFNDTATHAEVLSVIDGALHRTAITGR
ncbi:MAG TPA: hypothetical protein PJ994_03855 [Tepidiformaceae bacterium]|nr:hypothetical protein [Tepidiformaceae bacterium]